MAEVLPFERAPNDWVARKLNFRSARYQFQIALAEWLDLHDRSGAKMALSDVLASPILLTEQCCVFRSVDWQTNETHEARFVGNTIDPLLENICLDAARRGGNDEWPAAYAFMMTDRPSKTLDGSVRTEAHIMVLPFMSDAPEEGRITLVIAEWNAISALKI